MTLVPAVMALAYSNAVECPKCRKRLTVADGSRYLATLAGLLAGVLVWRLVGDTEGMLGWVKPVLIGFFAYSIVAPLALAFLADLRLKPDDAPAYEAGHTSGGGHH
jgi:hypothetical protein